MAKRGRPRKGEQLPLIDVGPENQDEILAHAKKHEEAMRQRMKWGKIECEEKQKVLELIHEANLSKLEGGKIKARCGDYIVTVTPRDELVQIEHPKGKPDKSAPAEKPTQGEPTEKEKKRRKRTVKSMQETVAEEEGQ